MVDWSWWSIVNNSNLNISDLIQTCFHQPIVFISCKAYRCMMKQKEKCVLVGCVYLLSERKKNRELGWRKMHIIIILTAASII